MQAGLNVSLSISFNIIFAATLQVPAIPDLAERLGDSTVAVRVKADGALRAVRAEAAEARHGTTWIGGPRPTLLFRTAPTLLL